MEYKKIIFPVVFILSFYCSTTVQASIRSPLRNHQLEQLAKKNPEIVNKIQNTKIPHYKKAPVALLKNHPEFQGYKIVVPTPTRNSTHHINSVNRANDNSPTGIIDRAQDISPTGVKDLEPYEIIDGSNFELQQIKNIDLMEEFINKDPKLYKKYLRVKDETIPYKEKSVLVAEVLSGINLIAIQLDNPYEDEWCMRKENQDYAQKIKKPLVDYQEFLMRWQNYYECIIGRTRNDITNIKGLPEKAKRQFDLAAILFSAVKYGVQHNNNYINTDHFIDNFNGLDPYVQKALEMAIEQDLHIQVPKETWFSKLVKPLTSRW